MLDFHVYSVSVAIQLSERAKTSWQSGYIFFSLP